MNQAVLYLFPVIYIFILVLRDIRHYIAWAGVFLLFLAGGFPGFKEVLGYVNWNVLGIFFGIFWIAESLLLSGVPAAISNFLLKKVKTVGGVALVLAAVSGFVSVFLENVATVLLLAPVAIEISKRLKISPAPLLIAISVSSNLQGTATLIGDPPSMILAGFLKLGFNDFFWFLGRPGIFFAVEVGALASFIFLYFHFKKYTQRVSFASEKILQRVDLTPLFILTATIIGLVLSSKFDPDFKYLAGVVSMLGGSAALVWSVITKNNVIKNTDWQTGMLLAGVFVLLGLAERGGVIEFLARIFSKFVGNNIFLLFVWVVVFAVFASAFVDNVPFVAFMLPLIEKIVPSGISLYLVSFGLLIGSCLGGNITPIGASANLVAVGISKKAGFPVSFWDFIKIGLPFTLSAVGAGAIFLWLFWGG